MRLDHWPALSVVQMWKYQLPTSSEVLVVPVAVSYASFVWSQTQVAAVSKVKA